MLKRFLERVSSGEVEMDGGGEGGVVNDCLCVILGVITHGLVAVV